MIANNLKEMQIDALVSEADIGGIATNQLVNFTVDAYPSRTFPAKVLQIRNAPQTNQNVITYDTVIAVNNSDLKLRPGMTASVSIITASRTNVLKIPNSALRFHPPEAGDSRKESRSGGSNSAPQMAAQSSGTGGMARAGGGANSRPKSSTRTVYVIEKAADGKEVASRCKSRLASTMAYSPR